MSAQRVIVTGATNPTHLVHVASYLRQALNDGPIHVSYVHGQVDLDSPVTRGLLPDDDRLRISVVEPAQAWSVGGDDPLTYVSVGAPGLKPWLQLRRASPRRRLRVVVTDEGLGTYGTWRTRRDAYVREGVAEPWRSIRTAAVTGGVRLLTTQRWPMYDHDGGRWRLVESVAEEFRRHVPSGLVTGRSASRRVVLLTQPWIELGVVSARDYLAHVEALAGQVDRAGGELSVRPHPAEPAGRYADHAELPAGRPAELDPVVVGAAAVLGGPSTALLNLAAVYGVPALRVAVPARPDLDADLGAAQASLLGQYVGAPVAEADVHSRLRLDRST